MATPSSSTPPASSSFLAPGFRFHPTDEELVIYYLKRKVLNRPLRLDAIAEVELYKAEPWDLPALSRLQSRDMEWYFFSPLDRKYANRSRTNRATNQGYWKTTGKDRPIRHGPRVVGMKKTLVFHVGRAPRGERTNWVMHEYRLEDDELARDGVSQDLYVVCRIFQKSGSGPQNGAQYGAPFVEEEWDEEAGNMPLAGDDSGDGDAENLVVAPVNGGDKAIAGNGEYLQLSDFADNQDQDNQPGNGGLLMPNSDGHNSGGAPEDDPIFLVEGIFQEQRMDDVSPNRAQNEGYLNLNNIIGVDEFFDPTNENTYSPSMMFQLNDLYPEGNDLNSILGDFPSNQTGEETLAFYDASSNDLPFGTDSFLQMDDLYPPMTAGSFGLNAMDDIATYFNNDSSASNESIFSPEVASRTPEPAQASEADVGASSVRRSTTMIENVTAAPDSRRQGERTFTRRLVDMLGSVPAPPALAAEPPTTPGKSLGQISATTPASSIHVTAGMIEIHGFKATGGVDPWSLHKDGDVGLLFSYGVASSKLDGSDSLKIRGWSMSVVLQGGFYLFFLSAMVLALCVKVGIHGYCS